MNKKWLLIISILFLAISIVLFILSLINYEFRFSYEVCMDLFGCEPQEFLDYEFEDDVLFFITGKILSDEYSLMRQALWPVITQRDLYLRKSTARCEKGALWS